MSLEIDSFSLALIYLIEALPFIALVVFVVIFIRNRSKKKPLRPAIIALGVAVALFVIIRLLSVLI